MFKLDIRNRIEKLRSERDIELSLILFMYLLNGLIQTVGRFVLTRMSIYGILREVILFLPTLIPFILMILFRRKIKKRNVLPFICIFAVVCITFLITILLHPEYQYYYTREKYGILRVFRPDSAIYAFLFFSLIDDPKKMLRTLIIFSYIDFAQLIIFSLIPALIQGYWSDISYNGQMVQMSYNLSFGYEMLFPMFMFLYVFLKSKKLCNKICHLVLSIICALLIFTQGSRGAILLIVIFLILMIISNIVSTVEPKSKKKKIIVFISCLIAMTVIAPLVSKLLVLLLKGIGIESRTLSLIAEGKFTDNNGRFAIWEAVVNGIKNGGIFGNGAYGDRPYVYPLHYAAYSHNIFLELICSFGVIGAIVSVGLIFYSFYMVFLCKETIWREMFIIFFSVSCQLLLSMSFWYVSFFWAAAAIVYKYFQLKRRNLLNGQK